VKRRGIGEHGGPRAAAGTRRALST
jgi:hypothetical protein